MKPDLKKWPLLTAVVLLVAEATALDFTSEAGSVFANALGALACAALGAFLYAEGVRHRDWTDHRYPDAGSPPTGHATRGDVPTVDEA